jgi:hypothetical protein
MATQPTDAKTLGGNKQESSIPAALRDYVKKCLIIVKNLLIGMTTIALLLLHFVEDAWGEYTKMRYAAESGLAADEAVMLLVGLVAFCSVWTTDFHHAVVLSKELVARLRNR